ncbi:hypothetical protein [Bacillus paramycoides]|uniref:hypothetical protein n=1 Tax=Bacillus paramycoides TaxID=2026194 RepID=UPI002E213220|nr:hypothetical protein [Bacillus paramycoides]
MSNRVKLEHAIKQILSEEGHVLLISRNPPRSLDSDLKIEREQLKKELLEEIKQELLSSEQRIFQRLKERDQVLMQYVREIFKDIRHV